MILNGFNNRTRHAVKPMTGREIINAIRRRRYQWGKPTSEISEESGVRVDVLREIIKGKEPDEFTAAKLTGYIRTPVTKWQLINDREKASTDQRRKALQRRVDGLCAMGRQWGIHTRNRTRIAQMTTAELKAYFWNIDQAIKDKILDAYPTTGPKYLLPDNMDAWEWLERIDALLERQRLQQTSVTAPGNSALRRRAIRGMSEKSGKWQGSLRP